MTASRPAHSWLGFCLVLAIFCAPLYVGLGAQDLRNDESIYSYAVDRILETGAWLTPRSIPDDGPFYEKPPLKFWMIAAGMRAGVLPRDERGMRLVDATFGVIAFSYMYWLGVDLGGVMCGMVALFVLFTLDPIVFDHGLRSNNMEASLVLSYAAGVFHFWRWRQAVPRARLHALAVALYFTLAFMTKDVAAVFLPLVCIVAILWDPDGLVRQLRRWRDWMLPSALAIVLIAPWFAYESIEGGREFWSVIVGAHIYQRFTSHLDPAHLRPWHFYFTQTWAELGYARSQLIVASGLLVLTYRAFKSRWFLARLLLIWGLLPVALISIGTSKLIHYAFPYWPVLGLGAGLAFADGARLIDHWLGPYLTRGIARLAPVWSVNSQNVRRARLALMGLAALALLVAAWTVLLGPFSIVAGRTVLFRNAKVLRPLLLAGALAMVAGYATTVARMIGVLLLCLLLPFRTYEDKVHQLTRIDHPLRAMRDCMLAQPPADHRGVFVASPDVVEHPYFYYLRKTGPYVETDPSAPPATIAHLESGTPVIIQKREYVALLAQLRAAAADERTIRLEQVLKGAVAPDDQVVVILPGDFAVCAQPMIAAGALPVVRPAAAKHGL